MTMRDRLFWEEQRRKLDREHADAVKKLGPKPAKKVRRKRIGYTFRKPNGQLDWRVVATVGAAQSNAAFDLDLPGSGREFPTDWTRAYNQGYRIVRAEIKSHGGNGTWKNWERD